MLKTLQQTGLLKKILFTFFAIIVYRFLAHVPIPVVDITAIRLFVQDSALFGLFDLFSGGGFQNFSIVALGLGPYINAAIIMQIMTATVPALEELQKEGNAGREKINQYTRMLTIPFSLIQAYGIYFLLSNQTTPDGLPVIGQLDIISLVTLILTMTAGGMILVWIGDMVTEYGIGNGISILIFAAIISGIPVLGYQFIQTLGSYDVISIITFFVVVLGAIVGVVLVNEGTRNIPLQYGRRNTQSSRVSNYLPLKVNQAGVIPIIFAVAIVILPTVLGGPLLAAENQTLNQIGQFMAVNFNPDAFGYNLFFFLLVIAFTFFYTFLQFNPEKIADDVKRRGGFIPGIRPGKQTKEYLTNVVIKITIFGSIFLGLIAILPYLVQLFVGIGNLVIGGAGLLIVVSVVLETIRQIESHTVSRSYESYLN